MENRTVRELGGEVWAEINMHYIREKKQLEIDDLQTFIDLTMQVLARHVGKKILNDKDFPVTPLKVE